MNLTTKKHFTTLVLIAVGIVLGIGLAYAVNLMQDFSNLMEAREEAPDKEKFDRDFAAMAQWFDTYKQENPGATDEDAAEAYDALWNR